MSELEQLIIYLNEEKQRLESLVQEAAKEWEFLSAHAHAEAIRKINRQLYNLESLSKPFHEEIMMLNYDKRQIKEKIRYTQDDAEKDVLLEKLFVADQAVKSFERNARNACDAQDVDDAIFDLVEGRIKSFRINLNKDGTLFTEFLRKGSSSLCLRLYGLTSLADDTSEESESLKTMGFEILEGSQFIEYTFPVSRFRDAILIKQFLAKVLFDIIGYYQIEKPVMLERFFKDE
jgi:hypothetical protein